LTSKVKAGRFYLFLVWRRAAPPPLLKLHEDVIFRIGFAPK
jgi:hypothetical protein